MKTFTIIVQYTASHGRPDGYLVCRRRGHTIKREYFKNYVDCQVKLEAIKADLRTNQNATHFKICLG